MALSALVMFIVLLTYDMTKSKLLAAYKSKILRKNILIKRRVEFSLLSVAVTGFSIC